MTYVFITIAGVDCQGAGQEGYQAVGHRVPPPPEGSRLWNRKPPTPTHMFLMNSNEQSVNLRFFKFNGSNESRS